MNVQADDSDDERVATRSRKPKDTEQADDSDDERVATRSRKPKDTEQADTQNLTKVKDENTWISKGNSFAKIVNMRSNMVL